ncbi:MFS transporter [Streptomyces sp. NPDC097704]|uniref:MFS transporter n=1 Tax=Streptomyces sp. NPDC097704 TaxID=3157101 RepID=UPI00332ED778
MALPVVAVLPAAWAAGALSMPVLCTVALLLGALAVLHQAASIAIVPELVEPKLLHPAHTRIASVFSISDAVGTYGGTLVIAVTGAVRALWLGAASYLVSAWCASRIRSSPPAPVRRGGMVRAMREGVGFVMRSPLQRPLVLSLATHAYADTIVVTYVAYILLTRLDAGSTGLGLVLGVTSAGGLVGALVATRLVARFGPACVMLAGFLSYASCGMPLLIARPGTVWLGVIALAGAARTAAAVAAGTTQRSIRQLTCPDGLQSRAQQTLVWLVAGARPFGAMTAGGIAAALLALVENGSDRDSVKGSA